VRVFFFIKRKFGATVRSKTPVAQTNEALLKVLCHNIVCVIHEIHQSGVKGEFPEFGTCPEKMDPALEVMAFG
jgi:hypothetical protein